MTDPEKELRATWTAEGVPQDWQDSLIADITSKAQPGAMVGPFRIKADFESHKHPVQAVACPDCQANAGAWCIRPSGHRAADFHRSRKDLADQVFIEQHGEGASIDRLPNDVWQIIPDGYRSELTDAGEQTVIPGCERDDARTGAKQLDLF